MGRRTLYCLVAGLLLIGAAAAPAAAAGTVFQGMWVSTDSDGSTQVLIVAAGASPAVTYEDFFASSCANDGNPATHFVAMGRGSVDGGSLVVGFRNGGCGAGKIGPFEITFDYDSGSDTLTDSFGVTWSRAP